ncbi:unnamed protein product [Effrenium voratum]|nr:unnamed protein product [Effrenium voratum]
MFRLYVVETGGFAGDGCPWAGIGQGQLPVPNMGIPCNACSWGELGQGQPMGIHSWHGFGQGWHGAWPQGSHAPHAVQADTSFEWEMEGLRWQGEALRLLEEELLPSLAQKELRAAARDLLVVSLWANRPSPVERSLGSKTKNALLGLRGDGEQRSQLMGAMAKALARLFNEKVWDIQVPAKSSSTLKCYEEAMEASFGCFVRAAEQQMENRMRPTQLIGRIATLLSLSGEGDVELLQRLQKYIGVDTASILVPHLRASAQANLTRLWRCLEAYWRKPKTNAAKRRLPKAKEQGQAARESVKNTFIHYGENLQARFQSMRRCRSLSFLETDSESSEEVPEEVDSDQQVSEPRSKAPGPSATARSKSINEQNSEQKL